MRIRPVRLALILAAAGAVALQVAVVKDVKADTAPQLTCGAPGTTPCAQTAHFSDVSILGTPLPPAAGCPSWLSSDFVLIVGSGNGIEHQTVNKAGDFWFTSTFTGQVTFTAYAPDQVDMSDPNNLVLIPGATPDSAVPVYSGKITEWFGASGNRQNAVFHDTINVSATAPGGLALTLHDNSQTNYTPGTNLAGPPHLSFDHFTC
jgi:hypothetical protein